MVDGYDMLMVACVHQLHEYLLTINFKYHALSLKTIPTKYCPIKATITVTLLKTTETKHLCLRLSFRLK